MSRLERGVVRWSILATLGTLLIRFVRDDFWRYFHKCIGVISPRPLRAYRLRSVCIGGSEPFPRASRSEEPNWWSLAAARASVSIRIRATELSVIEFPITSHSHPCHSQSLERNRNPLQRQNSSVVISVWWRMPPNFRSSIYSKTQDTLPLSISTVICSSNLGYISQETHQTKIFCKMMRDATQMRQVMTNFEDNRAASGDKLFPSQMS